jgi:hypothetical protein
MAGRDSATGKDAAAPAPRTHAQQLEVKLPESGCSKTKAPGATLVRPALERLRDVVAGRMVTDGLDRLPSG